MLTTIESRSLALARGSIVFLIAPIHCVMLYSSPEVKAGPLGQFMALFAEYPGAHLFMFLLGLFIAVSREKAFRYILKRSLLLLLTGYLLNIGKFVIPHILGLLPKRFYSGNHIINDRWIVFRLLLINDILHFAAAAYLLCGLLKKIRYAPGLSILLSVVCLIASPVLWTKGNESGIFIHAFHDLVGGFPPKAYFPVFPWIFHCLLGMIGGFWKKNHNRPLHYFLLPGVILFIIGYWISLYEPPEFKITFFRSGPGGTLLHGGYTLIFVGLLHIIFKKLANNSILNFVQWCSTKITFIYLVQWILIMWLLPITGYETLTNTTTLVAIIIVNAFTFLFVNYFTQKNTSYES